MGTHVEANGYGTVPCQKPLLLLQVSYGIEGTSDGSTVTSDTESLQLVNLDPFTSYTVTVTCVNDAGPGNSSLPITRRTNSARKRTDPASGENVQIYPMSLLSSSTIHS